MSWFLAFAGFAVLIILHEAGHFTAAKAVGMRVERFALFFPPYLARKKVGETEYALGSIPFGGFVKISGMNPDESLPPEVRDRAYHAQPVWKRVVVILAGPLVNVVLAFVLLFLFYSQVGPIDTKVGKLDPTFPAAQVLKPGDRVVAVDGHKGQPADLSRRIGAHGCAQRPPKPRCKAATPAQLLVERDGKRITLSVRPVYDAKFKRMRVGFTYDQDARRPLPFGDAVTHTTDQLWFITKETVKLPLRLFDAQKRKEVSSVVGGYEVTRQTILANMGDVLGVLAIISLSLAIINLFPFLPLDGGHIFWALVEKIRRKPVPLAVMERASVIGFLLVLGLFAIGLSNDIDRLSGEGFQVR
jgi:regulator of sigma E protease